ncbi:MAG: transcription antitermination factor NusB [Treponema sp.]
MSRRKGRVLAFQALYSYDVGGEPIDELLKLEWAFKNSNEDKDESEDKSSLDNEVESGSTQEMTLDFARLIINGAVSHLAEIDELIKKHLSGKWDFDRINKVSLAILRISVFSLLYQKETSPSIVIDEAIDIAKEYGADDAYKFINAVLDNIRKELPQE